MLPPPITRPTAAPSFTMSLISVARRFMTSKSNPTRLSPARASPESLSRTRWYLSFAKCRPATLRPSGTARSGEPGCARRAWPKLPDEIADGFLRLSHPRLVDEGDVLVVRLDLAWNDLLDKVIGLAALLHPLDEDPALSLDFVGGYLVLVHRNRSRRRNMLGDVLHQLLEVIGARDEVRLAVDLHHDADFAVVVDVAADDALAGLLAGALLRLGDSLGAEILDGLLHVPRVLLEGFLRFHHPGAGSLAQGLYILGCELLFGHRSHCPVSSKRRRKSPAA